MSEQKVIELSREHRLLLENAKLKMLVAKEQFERIQEQLLKKKEEHTAAEAALQVAYQEVTQAHEVTTDQAVEFVENYQKMIVTDVPKEAPKPPEKGYGKVIKMPPPSGNGEPKPEQPQGEPRKRLKDR